MGLSLALFMLDIVLAEACQRDVNFCVFTADTAARLVSSF